MLGAHALPLLVEILRFAQDDVLGGAGDIVTGGTRHDVLRSVRDDVLGHSRLLHIRLWLLWDARLLYWLLLHVHIGLR